MMMCRYPNLASTSDWLKICFIQSVGSTTHMWVETRHHYGIAAVLCLRRHFAGNQWWRSEITAFF